MRCSGRALGALLVALAGATPAGASVPAARTAIAADYDVTVGAGARELRVEAGFRVNTAVLALEDGLGPYVAGAEATSGENWGRAETRGDALLVPSCQPGPCRVRYTVRLADAALALRDRNRALYHTGAVLAPPSTWLARPMQSRPAADRYRFRVHVPRGIGFVTGVMPAGGDGRYEGRLEDLPRAPYAVFGPLETSRLRTAGGAVELAIAPGQRALSREAIVEWVERAAAAVESVYGRLPVPRVAVIVLPGGRRAIGFGTTLGHGGASIVVWLGAQASADDLRRDWVLTHEMAHLGLPNLPREQRWLEEGLATYLEPVARARAGQITPQEAWAGFVAGLPKGLPREGDGGLDGTRSWGRTYWGGALFYLLADLEIRERTGNRRSLDDALRGIVARGGTIAVRWPLARVLEAGDHGAGVDVLQRLHARLGTARDEVDLEALWARLGVRVREGTLRFDDAAPLAAIRRSMTAAQPSDVAADDDDRARLRERERVRARAGRVR